MVSNPTQEQLFNKIGNEFQKIDVTNKILDRFSNVFNEINIHLVEQSRILTDILKIDIEQIEEEKRRDGLDRVANNTEDYKPTEKSSEPTIRASPRYAADGADGSGFGTGMLGGIFGAVAGSGRMVGGLLAGGISAGVIAAGLKRLGIGALAAPWVADFAGGLVEEAFKNTDFISEGKEAYFADIAHDTALYGIVGRAIMGRRGMIIGMLIPAVSGVVDKGLDAMGITDEKLEKFTYDKLGVKIDSEWLEDGMAGVLTGGLMLLAPKLGRGLIRGSKMLVRDAIGGLSLMLRGTILRSAGVALATSLATPVAIGAISGVGLAAAFKLVNDWRNDKHDDTLAELLKGAESVDGGFNGPNSALSGHVGEVRNMLGSTGHAGYDTEGRRTYEGEDRKEVLKTFNDTLRNNGIEPSASTENLTKQLSNATPTDIGNITDVYRMLGDTDTADKIRIARESTDRKPLPPMPTNDMQVEIEDLTDHADFIRDEMKRLEDVSGQPLPQHRGSWNTWKNDLDETERQLRALERTPTIEGPAPLFNVPRVSENVPAIDSVIATSPNIKRVTEAATSSTNNTNIFYAPKTTVDNRKITATNNNTETSTVIAPRFTSENDLSGIAN